MSIPKRVTVAYMDYVSVLVHRVLSRHGSREMCPDCLAICRHCGDVGPQGTDHTCPCPNGDDCLDHPAGGRP